MADVKNALLSNMPVVIAGAIAIAAAGAWIVFSSAPDEDLARAPKPVTANAEKSDGLPPMRALPPAGTDLLPPLSAPPADSPKVEEATPPPAPKLPEPAKTASKPSVKEAVPTPPVTTAAAPPIEKPPPVAPQPKRVEKPAVQASALATGNYVGNISGGESAGGLTLVISSVEGGTVRGSAQLAGGGACDDTYPMQGSLSGGRLALRATKMGGRAGDCPLSLTLTVEGDRMAGSSGSGGGVQLKKR